MRAKRLAAISAAALVAGFGVGLGVSRPTADELTAAIEGTNGSHIWMRPESGAINKLHLRGPNTFNYDPQNPQGSYSQINLYADHIGLWGGTQPEGHAVYLNQQAMFPRVAGTLALRGWQSVQVEGLVGEGRRFACIEADGTVSASLTPCVGVQ
jgi:hypothetical protein